MTLHQGTDPTTAGTKSTQRTMKPHQAHERLKRPALTLQVGSYLDPGLRHKEKPNEDSLFVVQGNLQMPSGPQQPFALFVIADGMGGQARGHVASRTAGQCLTSSLQKALRSWRGTSETLLPLLKQSVQSANRSLYQMNQEQGTNMGTTMTTALVIGATAYIAHVGDSRLYLYHPPSGLSPITHDHSLVAALVSAGVIQPDDIYTHPSRNQIYRFLGEKPVVEVDLSEVPLVAGDTLLLCSDGLWEMVRDPQIASLLATPPSHPSEMARALAQAALAAGGEDNISVIVVRVSTYAG